MRLFIQNAAIKKSEDNAWTMKGASLCLSQDRGIQMAIVKNADFFKIVL